MDKQEELQKWLNDDRYVQRKELETMWNVGRAGVNDFLKYRKIKNVKILRTGQGVYVFYDKQQCVNARAIYNAKLQELQNWLNDTKFIPTQELVLKWGITVSAVSSFLYIRNIKTIKKIIAGGGRNYAFYDRAECERARPFINQPEKEVEKVEQVNLPEPKEQSPDIIPADTIDLFTMSELESELKQRGVELNAEVKAKINASDMPEMRHIATMLRGNAKTIAIRLSVLNEIVMQLKGHINTIEKMSVDDEHIVDSEKEANEWEKSWFDLWQKVDAKIDAEETSKEIKKIKKVLARYGSPTAYVCKDILQEYGYVGITETGHLLGITPYALQKYAQTFLPDIVAVMGYAPTTEYENGKHIGSFWKKERVLDHAEKQNRSSEKEKTSKHGCPKIYDNKFFDWHAVMVSDDYKQKLAKMAECDKLSCSLKIEHIINAAWIMGNYENK